MTKSNVSTEDVVRIVNALALSLRQNPGQFVSMHIESVVGFQAGGGLGGGYVNHGTMEASPHFNASAGSTTNDQGLVAGELEGFASLLLTEPNVDAVRQRWMTVKSALPAVLVTAVGELLAMSAYHLAVH